MTTILTFCLFGMVFGGAAYADAPNSKKCLDGACATVYQPVEDISCEKLWDSHEICLGAKSCHEKNCSCAGIVIDANTLFPSVEGMANISFDEPDDSMRPRELIAERDAGMPQVRALNSTPTVRTSSLGADRR